MRLTELIKIIFRVKLSQYPNLENLFWIVFGVTPIKIEMFENINHNEEHSEELPSDSPSPTASNP